MPGVTRNKHAPPFVVLEIKKMKLICGACQLDEIMLGE
jgi:hypothetical protein